MAKAVITRADLEAEVYAATQAIDMYRENLRRPIDKRLGKMTDHELNEHLVSSLRSRKILQLAVSQMDHKKVHRIEVTV